LVSSRLVRTERAEPVGFRRVRLLVRTRTEAALVILTEGRGVISSVLLAIRVTVDPRIALVKFVALVSRSP